MIRVLVDGEDRIVARRVLVERNSLAVGNDLEVELTHAHWVLCRILRFASDILCVKQLHASPTR